MIKEYEIHFSPVSLAYLLTTGGILGIVIICSASGFEILKEFIVALVENFDIHITLKNLIHITDSEEYELVFFLFSMIQVTYISRILGKFIDDGTFLDEIFMLLGSTCLSCFLGISYSLYPVKLLESTFGYGTIGIWLIANWIYGFVKAIQGVLNSEWGAYTFVFRNILYFLINPFMLGWLCVVLPTIFSVQLYAWLYDAVLYKNIFLLVIAVLLISYPLNKLCGMLIDFLLDIVSASYVGTVDILYGTFSVVLIIAWFVLMIFKTGYTDITFSINNEKYTYKAIKTVNRGIEEKKLWWGYFPDGTLIIDGRYGKMKDYGFDNSPWYEYRDKINRIVVLDGTEYIGNCGFCGMNNVKEIYISNDVNMISNNVFLDCKLLQAINVDKKNKVYSSVDGVLFDKSKTKLLKCPDAKKTIEIPETVTEIEEDFSYNNSLKTINVSDNNKNFSSRKGVLYNKAGTKLIRCPIGKKGTYSIDSSTKQIESYAFQYCRKLENVVLSDQLEEIGYSAFAGCKKMKKTVIPETVENINSNAFMDCEALEQVIFKGELHEIGYDVFLRSNPKISNLNLPLKKSSHTHSS